jgi:hypothetical protein
MSQVVSSFQYQEAPGVFRTAKIENTRQRAFDWNDPGWFSLIPGQAEYGGAYDGLTYLGTDGGQWYTKIATAGGILGTNVKPGVEFKSQSSPRLGEGEGNVNPTFAYVDWQGNKWLAEAIELTQVNAGEYSIALRVARV